MSDEREKNRILLEENRILMDELRDLQIKYVRLKLFKDKNIEEINKNFELEQKIDIILRFFLTGLPVREQSMDKSWRADKDSENVEAKLAQNEYSALKSELEKGSLEGLRKFLDTLEISPQNKAIVLTEFSMNLRQEDIKKAAQMAWLAWLYDPQPCRMKYLAFTMAEADEIFFADILLKMLPGSELFSEKETIKKNLIHERMKTRIEYVHENDGYNRSSLSSLRNKIMRLTFENEKNNMDKRNLLYLMKIKDEYLEKMNARYDKLENCMKHSAEEQ